MQNLLTELLWRNSEIDEAADQLRKSLPGFSEAQRDYETLAKQIQNAAGYDLYTRYFRQLMRYSNFEIQAYYALGLGLRQEIAQALEV